MCQIYFMVNISFYMVFFLFIYRAYIFAVFHCDGSKISPVLECLEQLPAGNGRPSAHSTHRLGIGFGRLFSVFRRRWPHPCQVLSGVCFKWRYLFISCQNQANNFFAKVKDDDLSSEACTVACEALETATLCFALSFDLVQLITKEKMFQPCAIDLIFSPNE